eukprot:364759-Chlamydomonas_euryale.AAC.25
MQRKLWHSQRFKCCWGQPRCMLCRRVAGQGAAVAGALSVEGKCRGKERARVTTLPLPSGRAGHQNLKCLDSQHQPVLLVRGIHEVAQHTHAVARLQVWVLCNQPWQQQPHAGSLWRA